MAKRRNSFAQNINQLAFDLVAPPKRDRDGALEGIDRRVTGAIAQILKDDDRSRFTLAGEISRVLDDDVSKAVLDKYASESADAHNMSVGRFLALIMVSGRYDILDALMSEIGASLLIGQEVLTAELGAIAAQEAALQKRKNEIKKLAPQIERFNGRVGG